MAMGRDLLKAKTSKSIARERKMVLICCREKGSKSHFRKVAVRNRHIEERKVAGIFKNQRKLERVRGKRRPFLRKGRRIYP